MPDNVYEVIAQGARYWFLFWMALIVWRSWRWYRKDRRAARKRLRLLPDAGYVGEMVVVEGGGVFDRGEVFPVPREGTVGMLRTNDVCVPVKGVDSRHLWFRYEENKGLLVHAFGKNDASVDGENLRDSKKGLYMAHGSWLTLGGVQLRLRMFAGFETAARAPRRADFAQEPPMQQPDPQAQQQMYTQEQVQQLWQQWQMQQQLQQMMQQQYAQQPPACAPQQPYEPAPQYEEADVGPCDEYQQPWPEEPALEWEDGCEALPYDMAQIAREEGMVDNSIYMRPAGQKKPELPQYEEDAPQTFYPPLMDEEDGLPDEEDWVLEPETYVWEDTASGDGYEAEGAAEELPRSAYVGHDEAERAKRAVWDKYFGGGTKA